MPDVERKAATNDPWQTGLCDAYAVALIEACPHLRLGVVGESDGEGGWVPRHYFAHDDVRAYDSLGVHPLPYLGVLGQFDHLELDQDIADWGLPENGGPDDVARALAEIRSRGDLPS